MTDPLPSPRDQVKASLSVNLAAMLIYYAFRLLGATKDHAWSQAKLLTVNGIMDKVVEKTGILDPRHKGKAGIQAFFEGGGPLEGSTEFVDECGAVEAGDGKLLSDDGRRHVYRRTDRKRGQQTIFEYRGLIVPPTRASDLDAAA